jgi:hypothetical protein
MIFVLFCIALSLFFKALIWFRFCLDSAVGHNIPSYESLNTSQESSIQGNPRTIQNECSEGELILNGASVATWGVGMEESFLSLSLSYAGSVYPLPIIDQHLVQFRADQPRVIQPYS